MLVGGGGGSRVKCMIKVHVFILSCGSNEA
jgi:hypothetical protein